MHFHSYNILFVVLFSQSRNTHIPLRIRRKNTLNYTPDASIMENKHPLFLISGIMSKVISFSILILIVSNHVLAQEILKKTFYDDEKTMLKEQFYVSDTIKNLLEGPYTSFYISGVTKSTGYFTNNLANGEWKYYNETGRIKQSGNILNGQNTGEWINYYENGNIRSKGELQNNVKFGEWLYFFENQNVKSRGFFENNLKQGVWNYFYEDAQLKAQAYYEDGIGVYQEFYPSGRIKMEGLNKYGKSDSLWVYYFDSGEKLAEGYFKEGLKTGTWKYYHKNQNLASEGGYETGKTIGNWIYYHENGTKSSEGIQSNGLKEGYWKLYYEEGTLKGLGQFEMGTGEYKEYYNSGNLKLEGQFKDGLNDGHWNYYDENGSLEGEADFEKGIGKYTGYYDNRVKKMDGVLEKGKRTGEWKLYKKNGELAGTYFPLYEEADPIFLTAETIENSEEQRDYDKPGFRLKGRKLRYFSPRVNEYQGIILSSNPLLTLVGQIPISAEYFIQERLGFELTYRYLRNPFFESHNAFEIRKLFASGHSISFTNKFYSKDRKYGMLYFGQQLGYNNITHKVNIVHQSVPLTANIETSTVSSNEQKWHYALIVGSRWMKNPSKPGLTFDAYVGIGTGRRIYKKNYTDSSLDPLFSSVKQSKSHFPFVFGLSIGYSGLRKLKAKKQSLKTKN